MFGIKSLRQENERLRAELAEARARLEFHERNASETALVWSELRYPSDLSSDREERREQIKKARGRAMFHLACMLARKATATPMMEDGRKVGVRYDCWVRPYREGEL